MGVLPSTIEAERAMEYADLMDRACREIDWVTALNQAHVVFLKGIAQNFINQLGPFGNAWPPRKDPKLKHPLLRLSLAMYNAAAVAGGNGQINTVDSGGATWGIDLGTVPYARAQNWGNPNKNLPAREYYWISPETEQEIDTTMFNAAAAVIGFN